MHLYALSVGIIHGVCAYVCQKGGEGVKITQKAEQWLDLPSGVLTGDVRVEIEGRRRLTADGDTTILSYDDEHICFRTRSGDIRVSGDALVLESLQSTGICVGGRLLSVEFL